MQKGAAGRLLSLAGAGVCTGSWTVCSFACPLLLAHLPQLPGLLSSLPPRVASCIFLTDILLVRGCGSFSSS